MGLLKDVYGLTEEQEIAMIRDGVVHQSQINSYEIAKHFFAIVSAYRSRAGAVKDCEMHFKVKRTTVYKAIKCFKNKKSLFKK